MGEGSLFLKLHVSKMVLVLAHMHNCAEMGFSRSINPTNVGQGPFLLRVFVSASTKPHRNKESQGQITHS